MPSSVPPNFPLNTPTSTSAAAMSTNNSTAMPSVSRVDASGKVISKVPIAIATNGAGGPTAMLSHGGGSYNHPIGSNPGMFNMATTSYPLMPPVAGGPPRMDVNSNVVMKNDGGSSGVIVGNSSRVQNLEVINMTTERGRVGQQPQQPIDLTKDSAMTYADSSDDDAHKTMTKTTPLTVTNIKGSNTIKHPMNAGPMIPGANTFNNNMNLNQRPAPVIGVASAVSGKTNNTQMYTVDPNPPIPPMPMPNMAPVMALPSHLGSPSTLPPASKKARLEGGTAMIMPLPPQQQQHLRQPPPGMGYQIPGMRTSNVTSTEAPILVGQTGMAMPMAPHPSPSNQGLLPSKNSTKDNMTAKKTTSANVKQPPNKVVSSTSVVPSNTPSAALQKNASDGNSTKKSTTTCDPTFATYVKLDPVPEGIPPLAQLNTREIAELEKSLQFNNYFPHNIGNNSDDGGWRDDWSGNLQLVDKDILLNAEEILKSPQNSVKPVTMAFREIVADKARNGSAESFRGIKLLFSYIYHMKGTPEMAKKIMAFSLYRYAKTVEQRLEYIHEAIRRISYDPLVLQQDGWTTVKSPRPDGASGGAYLIGRRVIWSRYEAIVIAFVRDDEIGDLWKAMWLEDLDTFDLEADELQEAIKKWETKENRRKVKIVANRSAKSLSDGSASAVGGAPRVSAGNDGKSTTKPTTTINGSSRFAATKDFTVEGIEHGIVLAATMHPNARHGVMWPARVMHVSEIKALGNGAPTSKRSSQKNQIPIIFLAPYWNGTHSASSSSRSSRTSSTTDYNKLGNNSSSKTSAFATGSLFDMECIEVSSSNLQKYPFLDNPNDDNISIDKLRTSFRFLGLPKTAFSRYLDAHRLALALKTFAVRERRREKRASSASFCGDHSDASVVAALTDTHTLAIKTALFPSSLLNLPYEYILESLPPPAEQASQFDEGSGDVQEPILQLHLMLKSMTPPFCWGKGTEKEENDKDEKLVKGPSTPEPTPAALMATPHSMRKEMTPVKSPEPRSSISTANSDKSVKPVASWEVKHFAAAYLLNIINTPAVKGSDESATNTTQPIAAFASLGRYLTDLVARLNSFLGRLDECVDIDDRRERLTSFSKNFLLIKSHGEDALNSKDLPKSANPKNLTIEWRKTCEKIFKCATVESALPGFGNGVSAVLTDSRCNQHITANGSYERAVRLPAALKGAKMAGAGKNVGILMIQGVKEDYLDYTERVVLPKAHKMEYLKRMKAKIAALAPDVKGAPLTDDSDGEGGEDTMGSRGSFKAAITAVAAALQAVDMVTSGQVVNVFCATRPPGHHAGKDLRAMNAISNGFCILNAAACAALYAVSPPSEGGRGLKRVCIIDFDVHHGNGTQEILCSTHDSRFLYVSTHAGGAHINGFDDESDLVEDSNGSRRILGGKSQEGIFPGRCGDTSPHAGVLNIPMGQKVTPSAIGTALATNVTRAVEDFSPELIIISAGFDAHRNDPLGMGGLSSEDFGSVTEIICDIALKTCSGRVISILEGGYGVPCCQLRPNLFLPSNINQNSSTTTRGPNNNSKDNSFKKLDLGDMMPEGMTDEVPVVLQQKLERCHQEGFLHCVKEHVAGLARKNKRKGYGKN